MSEPIGLIAGDGQLPVAIARAAAAAGRGVVLVAFPDITLPAVAEAADEVLWVAPGRIDETLSFLRSTGVREVVLAGKVSKESLVAGRLELDARGREVVARLADWQDATLLGAIAGELATEGIALLPQAELVPELLAGTGVWGGVVPTPSQWSAIQLGWEAARTLARLDIGQTVVVNERAIVAVEALEGTDETIRRAFGLAGPGLVIVKVARPAQDPRFDLPVVGPRTLATAAGAGAGVLAMEAQSTLVLERKLVVAEADKAGIALVGIPAAGPEALRPSAGGLA